VEAGIAAQLLGAPIAVVSGGIGCILAVIWVARKFPQVIHYSGDEPIRAGASAD
jgi:hypothetical protein